VESVIKKSNNTKKDAKNAAEIKDTQTLINLEKSLLDKTAQKLNPVVKEKRVSSYYFTPKMVNFIETFGKENGDLTKTLDKTNTKESTIMAWITTNAIFKSTWNDINSARMQFTKMKAGDGLAKVLNKMVEDVEDEEKCRNLGAYGKIGYLKAFKTIEDGNKQEEDMIEQEKIITQTFNPDGEIVSTETKLKIREKLRNRSDD